MCCNADRATAPEDNPGFFEMGDRARDIIVSWISPDWRDQAGSEGRGKHDIKSESEMATPSSPSHADIDHAELAEPVD